MNRGLDDWLGERYGNGPSSGDPGDECTCEQCLGGSVIDPWEELSWRFPDSGGSVSLEALISTQRQTNRRKYDRQYSCPSSGSTR